MSIETDNQEKMYDIGTSNKNKISIGTNCAIPVSTARERARVATGVKGRMVENYDKQMRRSEYIMGQAVDKSSLGDGLRFGDGSPAEWQGREKYTPVYSITNPLMNGIVSLYGRIDKNDKCTRYIDINGEIESIVLSMLDSIGISYKKVANGSAGFSRRYNILGWHGDCMMEGFTPSYDDNSDRVLSATGMLVSPRAKLLGLTGDKDGKWERFDKSEYEPGEFDSSCVDDFLYGYMSVTGRIKKGSKMIWSSAGQDTDIADSLHALGIKCTVLEEAGTNGYKFLTHLPDRIEDINDFLSSYSYTDEDQVKNGILAGSLRILTDDGVLAYVKDTRPVRDILGVPDDTEGVSGRLIYKLDSYDGVAHRTPYDFETAMFLDGDPVATLPHIFDMVDTEGLDRSNMSVDAPIAWSGSIGALHVESKIVSVHPTRRIDLYRVNDVISSMSKIILDRLPDEKPSEKDDQILMTPNMLATDIRKSTSKPSFFSNSPFKYSTRLALPINPYVLGVWLGDGFFDAGYICNEDYEVFKKLEKIGYKLQNMNGTGKNGNDSYRVVKLTNAETGLTLNKELIHAGYKFADTSRSGGKRIPDAYFSASYADRLELLRGLMDSDGSATGEFSSSYHLLVNDVERLIYELGMTCTITKKDSSYTYEGEKRHKKSYRIMVHTNERLFHIARKDDAHVRSELRRYRGDSHVKWVRTDPDKVHDAVTIVTAEPFLAGSGRVPVIAVDV